MLDDVQRQAAVSAAGEADDGEVRDAVAGDVLADSQKRGRSCHGASEGEFEVFDGDGRLPGAGDNDALAEILVVGLGVVSHFVTGDGGCDDELPGAAATGKERGLGGGGVAALWAGSALCGGEVVGALRAAAASGVARAADEVQREQARGRCDASHNEENRPG